MANEKKVKAFGDKADDSCTIFDDYLRKSLRAFGNYIKLIRECVFEEVRGEYFSTLPSRLCCLWVIPDSDYKDEQIKYWLDKLNEFTSVSERKEKIVALELNGYLFTASEKYLPYSSLNTLNEVRKEAFKYWSGCSRVGSKNIECLFSGDFKVLETYANYDEFQKACLTGPSY